MISWRRENGRRAIVAHDGNHGRQLRYGSVTRLRRMYEQRKIEWRGRGAPGMIAP